MTDTYTKRYFCENCNEWYNEYFNKGEVAHKGKCPFCGVSDQDIQTERLLRD